jgi:hypothetical protein
LGIEVEVKPSQDKPELSQGIYWYWILVCLYLETIEVFEEGSSKNCV